MSIERGPFKETLRIIWVVASKDIVDAIKNKTTISVLVGMILMMLTTQMLPFLLGLQGKHRLVVYDAGESSLVEALREDEALEVYAVDSRAGLETLLGESSGMWLGVVIPAGFGGEASPGGGAHLDGYYGHTASAAEAAEMAAFFEAQFAALTGYPVQIQIEGHVVYPTPDAGGRPFMVSMSLTIAVIIVSAFLVPYLMLEEKETRTMDVLLVSPASIGQVVMGKAIAGLVYGLVGAGVVLAFNGAMVEHWGWAFLAALGGTLFATAIGLLMGSIFDNAQNMSLWLGAILAALIMPVMLNMLVIDSWPVILKTTLPWVPSALLAKLFRASFAARVPLEIALPALGVVVGSAALVLAAVAWRVRQMDR